MDNPWVIFIAAIVIATGSFIGAINDLTSEKSLWKKVISFVCFLSIAIGSYIVARYTYLNDISSSAQSDRIETGVKQTNVGVDNVKSQNVSLLRQADSLKDKLESQGQTIDKLRKENTALASKLTQYSLEIYNNMTGGDSYCEAMVGAINKSNTAGAIFFRVVGKYPIHRLKVRIVDVNSNWQPKFIEDTYNETHDIGTLEPGRFTLSKFSVRFDTVKGVALNIFYEASNGVYSQGIRMAYLKKGWSFATQIKSYGGILYESIDPDFPDKDVFKK